MKIAFLVPIHPPHFSFAKNLLASWTKFGLSLQSDIWFIFTNEQERAEFGEHEHAIVLPEDLRIFENRGIINIKKFYGLRQIQNRYQYIIVLDAESQFVRKVDTFAVCEEYFTNRVLLGNELLSSEDGSTWNIDLKEKIKNSCQRFFTMHPDFEKLNNPLYLWFNQPSIYKTDTLDEFWKIIDYGNNIKNLKWHDFDYYVYMFYLILFRGFHVEDMGIKSQCGVCETSRGSSCVVKNDNYKKRSILMASQQMLRYLDNPKCFILIHLDRN